MVAGLTFQMARVVNFIAHYQRQHSGLSPTYREIARGIGKRSPGDVHRMLHRMAARGHVHFLPGQARSIQLGAAPDPIPREPGLRLFEVMAKRCAQSGVSITAMLAAVARLQEESQ